MKCLVASLNVGLPGVLVVNGKEVRSAFKKQPAENPVFLHSLHFEGDGQGNLEVHGGVDKAACAYPFEHYAYWESELGTVMPAASFGENLTLAGMTEDRVCIGDIWRIGEAIVQVSEPRQPCAKLGARHNRPDLVKKVADTGFTGYYFRVLQEGYVKKGDNPVLKERPYPNLTVRFMNLAIYKKPSQADLNQILECEALAEGLRQFMEKKMRNLFPAS
ncbi:MOSC domain-containing protein [Fictibacillus iocasae]|uniref:MOSC domain-containing protein n=1 Tax=Fictibacillus iocasae TaxID=2715437 RepID=A0ABW2NLQ0_9BACL